MCFRLSAGFSATCTRRISAKFDIGNVYENLWRNSTCGWSRAKISGISLDDLSRFCCPWRQFRHKLMFVQHEIFFILFRVTCIAEIHTEGIVAFPLQQWLRERATVLHYTCIAHILQLGRLHFSSCRVLHLPLIASSFSLYLCNNHTYDMVRFVCGIMIYWTTERILSDVFIRPVIRHWWRYTLFLWVLSQKNTLLTKKLKTLTVLPEVEAKGS